MNYYTILYTIYTLVYAPLYNLSPENPDSNTVIVILSGAEISVNELKYTQLAYFSHLSVQ